VLYLVKMAKLILQRFPDPRPEYDAQQSAELIRQLEEMIQQLNTQYTQDTQEESTRRSWFFS
tara:strand:- start:1050 stop:1235 length:186 start_codon:yes stop_codon:yes gene_type:complete